MTTNVWEDQRVTVTIRLKGKYKGEAAEVKFYKGAQHGRGSTQIGDPIPVTLQGKEITVQWTAPKVTPDTEINMPVHYQVERDGKKGSVSSDSGDLRVWAKAIKILPKNNANNSPLVGALFRVEQVSRAGGDGKRTKTFHLGDDDTAEGTEVELTHFDEPRITFVPPYELVRWTTNTGQKREALVRQLPARAVFKQQPEMGANPGSDGKFTRKQYVNLAAIPDDQRGPRNQGHTIKIKVGADRPITSDTRVYIDVKLGNPDGKFSRRNDPAPGLADYDTAEEQLQGEAPDETDEPNVPQDQVDPNLRFTRWKGSKVLKAPGTTPAEFDVELGLAGGDVFTIKIGMTDACADATLVITNWRKIGTVMWHPAAELTDFGKMDTDGGALGFAPASREILDKEFAKAFVEYVVTEAREFSLADFPDGEAKNRVQACSIDDGKYVGGKAGKKVFACDEDAATPIARHLLTLRPLQANEHISLVVDYLMEPETVENKDPNDPKKKLSQKHKEVVVPMTSLTKTIKVHNGEYALLPHDQVTMKSFFKRITLNLQSITIDGTTYKAPKQLAEITRAMIASTMTKEQKTAVSEACNGVFLLSTTDQNSGTRQQECVEIVDNKTIKVTLPTAQPKDPGTIFNALQAFNAKFTLLVRYPTLKIEDAVGVSFHEPKGLLAYPTKAGTLDLKDTGATVVHEVSHMIGLAYGSKADLPVSGRNRVIPGLRYRAHVSNAKGYAYDQRGHQGGHCAFGLTTSQKASSSYEAGMTPQGVMRVWSWTPQCLNFGQSWTNAVGQVKPMPLCAECARTIMAEDLRDLSIDYYG